MGWPKDMVMMKDKVNYFDTESDHMEWLKGMEMNFEFQRLTLSNFVKSEKGKQNLVETDEGRFEDQRQED